LLEFHRGSCRIDGPLDCQQHLRRPLNFVNDGPIQPSDETDWVGARCVAGRLIVESEEWPAVGG
jgi:hypothetical protein